METIGERLKIFAKVRFGSMKRLSEAIGERPDNLQKYAADKHQPGAKLLIKLAAEGLNVRWLLTGDESMYASDKRGSRLAADDLEMLAMLKRAGIEKSHALAILLSEMKTVLGARAELQKWFRRKESILRTDR